MQFRVRDLLWLVALAAICIGWWIDRNAILASQRMWKRRATTAADVLIGRGWIVTWGTAESLYELPGAATAKYPNVGDGTWNAPPIEEKVQ